MNISYRWLRSIAPTIEGTPGEIADRLGMLGAPVDEIAELGAELGDIVIARVDEVKPHPDADRLRLCVVDAGGAPLQVVCGAPNVEAGGYYPFAPVGATLPGGMQIRKAKLRGQVSEGMLCSARELGLGRDHTGLMALAGEWPPGSRLVESLGLDDARLVLDVTPNRPDLLSHLGVARELAPGGQADVQLAAFSSRAVSLEWRDGGAGMQGDGVRVTIEDPNDCSRYVAAVLEGVRVGPSPEWLATRLRAVDVRPINNLVDATNYVLHELGQPLHAFDLDTLAGPEIIVRRARSGESLRTLDGVDRTLTGEPLVIADRDRPIALAGIMGGEETEVTGSTSRVLIECALFDPLVVRRAARAAGLSTDASHRFERGVDFALQRRAVERVVDLILAIAGGRVTGPVLDAHPRRTDRSRVDVRPARVRQVLGVEVSPDAIEGMLVPIGFTVASGENGAVPVEVPSYRPDVTREIDVIEEIARRRGYDTFPAELTHYRPGIVPDDPIVAVERTLRQVFGRWGFLEARTAAFAPASENRAPLLNPLSAEESHLRDDLIRGLVRRVEYNWARGARAIRLYEIGTVFHPSGGPAPSEEVRVGAVLTGPSAPPHWSETPRPYDVWDLKGLLGDLGGELWKEVAVRPGPAGQDVLDPAESFVVVDPAGRVVGRGGRVRSGAMDAPRWADALWALELEIASATVRGVPTFADLPAYPPVDRDLALLVPRGVSAEEVERVIRRRAGDLLEEVWPFDLYEGEGIAKGARSIAWRLRFRHPERTLTDADVDDRIASVLKGLEEELSVHRR